MEIRTPLSIVGGVCLLNNLGPVGALDSSRRSRVGAIVTRIQDRISLQIDVERLTTRPEAAALRCTVRGIVRGEFLIAKIPTGRACCLKVLILQRVPRWQSCAVRDVTVD